MKTESEFWALMFLAIAVVSFLAQFVQVMVNYIKFFLNNIY